MRRRPPARSGGLVGPRRDQVGVGSRSALGGGAQFGQHQMAPHGHRAGPGDHVAGDAGHDRAQAQIDGRHTGLVGQVGGDAETGESAPALGPADLVARARVGGDARARRGVGPPLPLTLPLPLSLSLALDSLALSGSSASCSSVLRWWLTTRPSLDSASRWRSNTKWIRRSRSSLVISSNTSARRPSSSERTTRARPSIVPAAGPRSRRKRTTESSSSSVAAAQQHAAPAQVDRLGAELGRTGLAVDHDVLERGDSDELPALGDLGCGGHLEADEIALLRGRPGPGNGPRPAPRRIRARAARRLPRRAPRRRRTSARASGRSPPRSNTRTGILLPSDVVSLPSVPPTLRRMTWPVGSGWSAMALGEQTRCQRGGIGGRQRAVQLEAVVDVGDRHAADVRQLGGDARAGRPRRRG